MPTIKPLSLLLRLVKYLFVLITTLTMASVAFLYLAPTFGADPSGDSLKKIKASPNYHSGRFSNLTETRISTRDPSEPLDLASWLNPPEDKNPREPLPSKKFDAATLTPGSFVWLGHSTILFNTNSLIILTDPVFNRASPIPVFGKPFALQHSPSLASLPEIDIVLISHDHYDHLDHVTITGLAETSTIFLVPLGVGAHLQRWGIPHSRITEFDWYDSHTIHNTEFTMTPARHFSGRGLTNRDKTLWGSWVVKSTSLNVFFSGDTGYFEDLKSIGKNHGPFDISFIENGAYHKDWAQIHMMPEESVQASVDINSKVYFPIHWGKFDLAQHRWKAPVKRATAKARQLNVTVATPIIGEVFTLSNLPQQDWWTNSK